MPSPTPTAYTLDPFAPEVARRFLCVDCGTDTCQNGEYYMVRGTVWAQTGLGPHDGMLCIRCLEKRIGRALLPLDFTNCPLNQLNRAGHFHAPTSELLLSRMTG